MLVPATDLLTAMRFEIALLRQAIENKRQALAVDEKALASLEDQVAKLSRSDI